MGQQTLQWWGLYYPGFGNLTVETLVLGEDPVPLLRATGVLLGI
jgi:hypothetical protein